MAFSTRNMKLKQNTSSQIRIKINNGAAWFCNTTNLHGFYYVTNNKFPMFAHLFFAIAVCSSFLLFAYLIRSLLLNYNNQSIITTIVSTTYPVWKVPFPSITICNFNIVYKDNVDKFTEIMKTHGVKKEAFTEFIGNLSYLIAYDDIGNTSDDSEIYDALSKSGYSKNRLMEELAHPCESMIKQCFWQLKEVPCSNIFQRVITNQGYCCSFNNRERLDSTISEISQNMSYQYVNGAGPSLGMKLLLDIEKEQYMSPIKPLYGLNVLVQDGTDYPDMDLNSNTLLQREELTISVKPKIYAGSKNIRNMEPFERQCLFENEGTHQWTSSYSYQACINECTANKIFKACGCLPFYYPTENSTRICTLQDMLCLRTSKRNHTKNFEREHHHGMDFFDDFAKAVYPEVQGTSSRCDCYQQCNEIKFDLHTDRIIEKAMDGFENTNMSMLYVYYNTLGCEKTIREVYNTWNHILGMVGGVFGLCLGGSIISILECFYFFGKCFATTTKIEPNTERNKETLVIYTADFVYNSHGNNFYKKPLNRSTAKIIAKEFRNQ